MDNATIAHALFDAMEARDRARFLSHFTSDATVWHNFDPVARPAAAASERAFEFFSQLRAIKYGDRRYQSVLDGVIVQHTIHLTAQNGRECDVHAMQRIYLVDGRIKRIDEYLDPHQADVLFDKAT